MLALPSALLAVAAAALAALSSASPLTKRYNNAITSDAPFSQTDAQFAKFPPICPYGVSKSAGKNILFIPGTAEPGDLAYSKGYVPAFQAQGYSPCYVNLPNNSLSDAQVTSEYVVKQIDSLYSQAGNKPFTIVGHSQGNLNIQWALNFWPTRRRKISNFVSLSGDFHGTAEGQLVLAAQYALLHGGSASVIQQSVILGKPTNFLTALNKNGDQPLVPTTSLYGDLDEVIQPVAYTTTLENTPVPDSFAHLDLTVLCALRTGSVVDHFRTLLSAPAFWLLLDALQHPGQIADVTRARALAAAQKQDFCADLVPGAPLTSLPTLVADAVYSALDLGSNDFDTQTTQKEPALKPYAASQP